MLRSCNIISERLMLFFNLRYTREFRSTGEKQWNAPSSRLKPSVLSLPTPRTLVHTDHKMPIVRDPKMQPVLLIADDDRWLVESLSEWLSSQGYVVVTALTPEQALQRCAEQSFDLVLTDIRFDSGSGTSLIRKLHAQHPELPILAMSGYIDSEIACDCIAAGAFDFLCKPIQDIELAEALDRALQHQRLAVENRRLKRQLDRHQGLEPVLSNDPRMQRIFDTIDRVADTRATILVTGENGTGKSMIARSIHRKSSRRQSPFVEVACGALPDALLESELFGHLAGAFTGAIANKIGKFQQADHGTLFLDEIGVASAALQVKLLRVLQELQFEALGGSDTISVDTRTILATNENLEDSVALGRFRQDLFYRINVIRLELPPLRERTEDIPMLVRHFLDRATADYQRDVTGVTHDAMRALQQHAWPGNIRELENTIQRAVLLCRGKSIDSDLLHEIRQPTPPSRVVRESQLDRRMHPWNGPLAEKEDRDYPPHPMGATPRANSSVVMPLSEALEEPERQIILHALRLNQWNRHATAEQLGINRTTLYKKMKRLGIDTPVASMGTASMGNSSEINACGSDIDTFEEFHPQRFGANCSHR
jgi:DNA-binding NtrC family response regulator